MRGTERAFAPREVKLANPYLPRRPTETVLYRAVRLHLETFLAHAEESYAAPLPRYVRDELRGYLRCGVFAHGFVRARCEACQHELLVAFSCKGRGVCPSCAGRRMNEVAAHLVDRVLPAVPVRQWVLSLPYALRQLPAFDPAALGAFVQAFAKAIERRHVTWATSVGLADARFGAVTFVQRFGSSLNLNVHFHVVVLDGVFTQDEQGAVLFHPAPVPARAELERVALGAKERTLAWLTRRGEEGRAGSKALDACAALACRRGLVREVGEPDADVTAAPIDAPPREGGAVDVDGFNLHASVSIDGDDDRGRELLCRYAARPPLALGRLRALPGGKLAYRVKTFRGGRAKVRVMTPLELLARLAALVPPPRYPLVRYHGVLAPRSSWRSAVVPKPRTEVPPHREHRAATRAAKPAQPAAPRDRDAGKPASPANAAVRPKTAYPSTALVTPAIPLAPNILSVAHWERLNAGALLATTPRVDWATLLRRTFSVDVLSCTKCGGRLRVMGMVDEPWFVSQLLSEFDIPTEAPRAARARDPTTLEGDEE